MKKEYGVEGNRLKKEGLAIDEFNGRVAKDEHK